MCVWKFCWVLKKQFVECDQAYLFVWKANAIISFNNRPATEAVPYFELVIMFVY